MEWLPGNDIIPKSSFKNQLKCGEWTKMAETVNIRNGLKNFTSVKMNKKKKHERDTNREITHKINLKIEIN